MEEAIYKRVISLAEAANEEIDLAIIEKIVKINEKEGRINRHEASLSRLEKAYLGEFPAEIVFDVKNSFLHFSLAGESKGRRGGGRILIRSDAEKAAWQYIAKVLSNDKGREAVNIINDSIVSGKTWRSFTYPEYAVHFNFKVKKSEGQAELGNPTA